MQDRKRDTDVKNRILDYVGEGEGGMIWENSTENMCIIIGKVADQCKFDTWSRVVKAGALGQTRGIEWGGRWEGEFRMGGHMYARGWFISMYGKPTIIL